MSEHVRSGSGRFVSVRLGSASSVKDSISQRRFVFQAESVGFGSVRVDSACCVNEAWGVCSIPARHGMYLMRTSQRTWRVRVIQRKRRSVLTTRATQRDEPRATRSGPSGVGCQDGWRGINRTYAKLRATLAVNLNLNMSCSVRKRALLYR